MNTDERTEQERIIAEKLENSIKNGGMSNPEIAEQNMDKILKALLDCEPLGDLNMPVTDMIALIAVLQENLSMEDYQKVMCVFALMYGMDDDTEFMKRVVKTAMILTPKE